MALELEEQTAKEEQMKQQGKQQIR